MIDYKDERFDGTVSAGWIRDLESSDSRIHKEKVIEKALMASFRPSAMFVPGRGTLPTFTASRKRDMAE